MCFLSARIGCICVQGIFLLATPVLGSEKPPQYAPGQRPPAQSGANPPGQVAPGQSSESNQNATPAQQAPTNAPDANGPSVPVTFESRGLEYDALTKSGITVMFAALPPHIKDFNVVQVTVTNGSLVSWTVQPTDITFIRSDGLVLQTVSADDVVENLLARADRNDVIKLQLLYENSIYALSNFRSTNGYEQRREAAMAQFVNRGFKAAAAASAIAFVPIKLKPGDSTDGAIFFQNKTKEKGLGAGRLMAHVCGETFIFETFAEYKKH
jgi:hypothetical protein